MGYYLSFENSSVYIRCLIKKNYKVLAIGMRVEFEKHVQTKNILTFEVVSKGEKPKPVVVGRK